VVADACGGGRRHSARARRVTMRPINMAAVVPGPSPRDVSAVRRVADAARTLNGRQGRRRRWVRVPARRHRSIRHRARTPPRTVARWRRRQR
jgi:hypothetical protein